jgi:hypothetical protein
MRKSVYLNKIEDKVFINKMSVAQEEWVEERVGYNRFVSAFSMSDPEKDFPIILKVFWEMLETKDKDKLLRLEFFKYEGLEKIPYKPKDEVDLIKHVVSGTAELVELAKAMLETITQSLPDQVETTKKKVTAV